ncbi:MAG TPA: peptide chain release factor N(5)-glutamine methyltransferase, partial [Anaeromyxobacteraceae bacterium]|nr:peptide chain release factor N(5)-glutamine methyltransferase [Anaeromyxobacteraceae bacterium]
MTYAEAIAASGLEPREARLLLAEACGQSQAQIAAFPGRELASQAAERFFAGSARRRAGEPMAYILGRKEFYGLELAVDARVLVPRPETELLVELALAAPMASLADLGTGCGAIALAVKRHRPAARVVGVEASASALAVAAANASRLALDVELRPGRWFDPLGGERFDVVVSNPPYVAMGDPHLPALRFEPASALVAGSDGLEALREIVAGAPAHLTAGGRLLLEHGQGQDASVRRLLEDAGFAEITTYADLAGIGRVTGGKR